MNEGTEFGTQLLDSSSETIELSIKQEPQMDTPDTETSTIELTLRPADERIEPPIDRVLRGVEEFCALLARQTEVASGSRRNHESTST